MTSVVSNFYCGLRIQAPMISHYRSMALCLGFLLLAGPVNALDQVVLQLKWQHQFQFAGYYAAIAQGYYEEAGLEVELREAKPGQDAVREVLEGRAQFGVGTSDLVLRRAQGEPLVVLAVVYQHSPFVLLSTAASGVRDIHDLAEKPIMMEPGAGDLLAYFKHEGVDPRTLKLVPHSFDPMDLVNDHSVGGMSAYSTDEPLALKVAGIDYLIFSPRASGIDFYGDNLFTTENQLKEHRHRVKAFLDASLRGWEYAMQHPEEIVDLILAHYSKNKTREQLLFEAAETARLVHPELIELGYLNPGRWQAIANTYEELGMIPAGFTLDGFLYQPNPKLDLGKFYAIVGGLLLERGQVHKNRLDLCPGNPCDPLGRNPPDQVRGDRYRPWADGGTICPYF